MTTKRINDLRAKHIGFVYQRAHLLPDFTVLENVMMPLRINGYQLKSAQKLAQESLDAVGLSHVADYMPNALSGGMQQRVAIARAVVHKPRIIFADEPTGNLDSVAKEQCMHYLISLQRDIGAALCIVTHDDWVAGHADQIIQMEAINASNMGRIGSSIPSILSESQNSINCSRILLNDKLASIRILALITSTGV